MPDKSNRISRRNFLLGAGAAVVGVSAGSLWKGNRKSAAQSNEHAHDPSHAEAHDMAVVGECTSGTLDPDGYLTHFHYGDRQTPLADGRTFREYEIHAVDKEIEIAPGVFFPSWAYAADAAPGSRTGHVPGPTIRARQGDRIRIDFYNEGSHPHTMHFHGFHSAEMDGAMPSQYVQPGQKFVYEFDAEPFGLHLYHCHSVPLKRHIHKGLYGVFIVDPPQPRPQAREFVMVMNGFDTNFDGENEVYAVNSVAHHHMRHPIKVQRGELIRVYLVNLTEFDPINSFHIHANFFEEYRTGTRTVPDHFTDTVMMCQGERSILEMRIEKTGLFMFHAHQSEFAELGWMGFFEVGEPA
jgi:FtsP/CotA-like multicopper oxidase with cupredoxin domain